MRNDFSSNFNLIHEKWIPCLHSDGNINQLGIMDSFLNANEIIEISHNSPLVVGSIYRLLLAIIHRSIGNLTFENIGEILENEELNTNSIRKYLKNWENRFFLYDSEHPFFQCPGYKKGKPVTVNKLGMELSAGNNTILFDHKFDDQTEYVRPETISQYLLASQSFSLGGGKRSTINFKNSPLIGKALIIIRGKTLFETLVLNLVPYNPDNPRKPLGAESASIENDDYPSWESNELEPPGAGRYVRGYLDYLTWQSRCINLIPESFDGNICTRSMYFAQGTYFKDELIMDPLVAYAKSEKYGIQAIQINREKDPWRSYSALTHISNKNKMPPLNIQTVAELIDEGMINPSARYVLEVIGMCNKKAKVHQWCHTRIPLPLKVLEDQEIINGLDFAIQYAELIGIILNGSLKYIFKQIQNPEKSLSKGSHNIETTLPTIYNDVLLNYWSSLEIPFYSFIDSLAKATSTGKNAMILEWTESTVNGNVFKIFEKFLTDIGHKARNLQACVYGRSLFYSKINKSIKKVREKYDIR